MQFSMVLQKQAPTYTIIEMLSQMLTDTSYASYVDQIGTIIVIKVNKQCKVIENTLKFQEYIKFNKLSTPILS